MNARSKNVLGRGLSALIPTGAGAADQVDIDLVVPNPLQPRAVMDQNALAELAESIRTHGVIQPLLVSRTAQPDGSVVYQLIAGERRLQASRIAGLQRVPVVIREAAPRDLLELALVENVQRQDLTPLEEADGYKRLMEEFSHTQEKLAETVGKSRSHVANTMRLLGLPEAVKDMLQSGVLTAGHARALLTATDPVHLAREIARRGLSVREAERLAGEGAKKPAGRKAAAKDADIRALERDLAAKIGLKVDIRHRGTQGGTLSIHYTLLEQLDDVIGRLSRGGPANAPGNRPAFGSATEGPERSAARIAVKLRPVKTTGTG